MFAPALNVISAVLEAPAASALAAAISPVAAIAAGTDSKCLSNLFWHFKHHLIFTSLFHLFAFGRLRCLQAGPDDIHDHGINLLSAQNH